MNAYSHWKVTFTWGKTSWLAWIVNKACVRGKEKKIGRNTCIGATTRSVHGLAWDKQNRRRDEVGFSSMAKLIRNIMSRLACRLDMCTRVFSLYDKTGCPINIKGPGHLYFLSHEQQTNSTFYLQFIFRGLHHLSFLFGEFFRVDQGRLTFKRLDLLVSFRLPSKSEL